MDKFLSRCHNVEEGKIPRSIGEQDMKAKLVKSIMELNNAVAEPLVKFLPIILDKLILMVIRPPIIGGQIGKPVNFLFLFFYFFFWGGVNFFLMHIRPEQV